MTLPSNPLHLTELQQVWLKEDHPNSNSSENKSFVTTPFHFIHLPSSSSSLPLLPVLGMLDGDGDEEVIRERRPVGSSAKLSRKRYIASIESQETLNNADDTNTNKNEEKQKEDHNNNQLKQKERDNENGIIREKKEKETTLFISHLSTPTSLVHVGQQLWTGCFLMNEFILHFSSLFQNNLCIEFGCGVGFTSLILSLFGSHVFATDNNYEVLEICEKNVLANSSSSSSDSLSLLSCSPSSSSFSSSSSISVRCWDWTLPLSECALTALLHSQSFTKKPHQNKFDWKMEDCEKFNKRNKYSSYNKNNNNACIFVAADIIYDDDVTEAFVIRLTHLLMGGNKLFISIDRRVVFTLQDLAPVPHAYLYFIQELRSRKFRVQCVPLSSIPQKFFYLRTSSLQLLLIESPLPEL